MTRLRLGGAHLSRSVVQHIILMTLKYKDKFWLVLSTSENVHLCIKLLWVKKLWVHFKKKKLWVNGIFFVQRVRIEEINGCLWHSSLTFLLTKKKKKKVLPSLLSSYWRGVFVLDLVLCDYKNTPLSWSLTTPVTTLGQPIPVTTLTLFFNPLWHVLAPLRPKTWMSRTCKVE